MTPTREAKTLAEKQLFYAGMALLCGGMGLGVLMCFGLARFLAADKSLAETFTTPRPRPVATKDQASLLLASLASPYVDPSVKLQNLSRLSEMPHPEIGLSLILCLSRENPLPVKRAILKTLSLITEPARLKELLIRLIEDPQVEASLRLDAAERLLAAAPMPARAVILRVVSAPAQCSDFKARLLGTLSGNLNAEDATVLVSALFVQHMHVKSAALSLFKEFLGSPGEEGRKMRERASWVLANTILFSGIGPVSRTLLRLLIDAESRNGRNPSQDALRALKACLTLRPDNRGIEDVVALAAEGAGRLGAIGLIGELKRLMYGRSDLVRDKAVGALNALGAEEVIPRMAFTADYAMLSRIHQAVAAPPRAGTA